ncbi:MFS transporter [Sphaerochaeta sp. PS]|uniref:MFS transporter n=1 Tax=Sphaerochaeta sp. PS TaxID=3076336 RepID=UPI0028A4E892|nr:MFS transporter [Sphaerochaeta sp. PS]MDT4763397.1 MFS transporter [Sphaerochaeta sp. PS]
MPSIAKVLRVKKDDAPLMYTVYFAFFTSGLMSTLIGAILPFMKAEYNMSYVLSGAIISAHQIGNFCALLISGFLPYLIGRKKSTITLSLGMVLGFLLMTLTANPLFLLLAFLLTGVGRGTTSNICNVVMSEVAENKTASLNLLHASFAVGAFLAPFLAILSTAVFGVYWRISAWTVVVLEVLVLFFFARSSLSGKSMEKKKDAGTGFMKSKSFWLNTSILFFYLCSEASIIGWLVTYFTDSGILSPSLAQTTSSALWVFILIGRLLCASISTKMNRNLLLVLLGFFQVVFFLLMISATNYILIYASIFGFGLAMSGTYPTVLSTMNPKFNASTVAMGTCIATATLGAIIMPIVVGAVAQGSGIVGGLATISFALVCMFTLILIKFFVGKKRLKNVQTY